MLGPSLYPGKYESSPPNLLIDLKFLGMPDMLRQRIWNQSFIRNMFYYLLTVHGNLKNCIVVKTAK